LRTGDFTQFIQWPAALRKTLDKSLAAEEYLVVKPFPNARLTNTLGNKGTILGLRPPALGPETLGFGRLYDQGL
jgi:hypothetical protein